MPLFEWSDLDYTRLQCCPMDTVPVGCTCGDGCGCACLDCICDGWGEGDDDVRAG